MYFYNYNEMFILALVSISIVGVVCLGLLVALVIFFLVTRRERGQQMDLNKDHPITNTPPPNSQDKEKIVLTVSDWVNYFSSERFGIIGTILGVMAVLVALVTLIYSTSTNEPWKSLINGIVVIAATAYLYIKMVRPLTQRGQLAQKMLKQIMTGELQTEESIRTTWLNERKSKKIKGDI